MSARARVVLGLTALFAANLSLCAAIFWLAHSLQRGGSASEMSEGFLIGTVMTIGLWLAFGDGKWYRRLTLCFTLIVITAFFEVWAISYVIATPSEAGWWVMLVMLLILLVSFAVLWPLRRISGSRLTWRRDSCNLLSSWQFQTGDLLFWTSLIAGLLAASRALSALRPGWATLTDLILPTLSQILVAAAAMSAVFGRKRAVLRWTTLLAITALVGTCFLAVGVWNQLHAEAQTAPWPDRIGKALGRSLTEALPLLSSTFLVVLNCLALRALGCRLVHRSTENRKRPASPAPSAGVECSRNSD